MEILLREDYDYLDSKYYLLRIELPGKDAYNFVLKKNEKETWSGVIDRKAMKTIMECYQKFFQQQDKDELRNIFYSTGVGEVFEHKFIWYEKIDNSTAVATVNFLEVCSRNVNRWDLGEDK